jgi:hypothetical protein
MDTEKPDQRWIYKQWEDMPPSDEELQMLKKMLGDAIKGTLWNRIVAILTFLAVALLVWILRMKTEVHMMIKDQNYEQDRARHNRDRIDDDDLIGQPKPTANHGNPVG